ncbi:response regulator transcription factor [Gloeobacter morelensis]|uniref:response regulator transcription factor n=1 Tax=Gloeobacter morelensis TaxID=2907343 RepID=UPI001E3195EE|nr:response regulator transcription factor [Gloeobacter morelensis]UFP97204.1 response regulator transcription factor [Gloeobacter morelensis MG652769]
MNTHGEKISVFIAEDQELIRKGICALVEESGYFWVSGEANNGADAVVKVLQCRPCVVLMDLRMPPGMGGTEATRTIVRRWSEAKILILTMYKTDEDIYHALKAGAKGYMLKGASAPELYFALKQVHQGASYVSPAIAERSVDRAALLTPREREILVFLAEPNITDSAIADRIHRSVSVVRFHTDNIFRKLGVGDRASAITEAAKRGLIHFD